MQGTTLWRIQTLHPNATVGVIANKEVIEALAANPLLRTLIPGKVDISAGGSTNEYAFILKIEHDEVKRFWSFDGTVGHLKDRLLPKLPSYVIVLLWQLIDATLQSNGIFTLHASGVALRESGRCVLFLGPEGSGKTALAISATEMGHSVVGNNRVSIRNGEIIGGTLMASIRPVDADRYSKAYWFASITRPFESAWSFLDLDQAGLAASTEVTRGIERVILPRVSLNRVYETTEGDASQVIVDTYGAASRTIQGDCLIFGPANPDAQPAPYLDNQELAKHRLTEIQKLVLNTPRFEAVGAVNDILTSCLPIVDGERDA
jgi:hypothetical protein